jgi:hypothetical protein
MISGGGGPAQERWLLLIHQIPPKPDYLRVKIGRRLQQVGAVALKNSVYLLPDREQSLEDFQWIRSEIIDGGGDASICRADFVDGLAHDEIRHLFRAARNADYAEVTAAARERRRGQFVRTADEIVRLRKRLDTIAAIDFFAAPERGMAEEALRLVEAQHPAPAAVRATALATDRGDYRGRTWVTRRGVFVDRIASAWLVQRYIDPDARFKFVEGTRYRPARGELRFDMFEGEFTHEGDRCTFETLMARFALDDPALGAIAEVVHDIDLKDGKFGREDAAGIERVLAGIVAAHLDDDARLARGAQLFDELRAVFARDAAASAPARM